MKTLVVFYSRSGTTKKLAEDLAEALKADKEEIIDLRNRKGILGYLKSGMHAALRKHTEISQPIKDPSKYDLIILGTPVWSSSITPALRTYMRCHKDKFGHVACFCTMGGSHPGKAFSEIENALGKKPLLTISSSAKEVENNLHKDKIIDFTSQIKTIFKK